MFERLVQLAVLSQVMRTLRSQGLTRGNGHQEGIDLFPAQRGVMSPSHMLPLPFLPHTRVTPSQTISPNKPFLPKMLDASVWLVTGKVTQTFENGERIVDNPGAGLQK